MQKRKLILWVSAWAVLLPLVAFGADTTAAKPTAPLTADSLEAAKKLRDSLKAERQKNRLEELKNDPDALEAEIKRLTDETAAAKRVADAQAEAEKAKTNAPTDSDRAPHDAQSWKEITDLIPNFKMIVDTAPGGKGAASVHLEGSVPLQCIDSAHIDGGKDRLVGSYTLSTRPRISTLDGGNYPFSGYRIQTSKAAVECVAKFKKDGKRCNKDLCFDLKDAPKITDLRRGPKVGFYACDDEESGCKIAFFNEGKAESEVPRIAELAAINDANRQLTSKVASLDKDLKLWQVRHSCYDKKTTDQNLKAIKDLMKKLDKGEAGRLAVKRFNADIEEFTRAVTAKSVKDLPTLARTIRTYFDRYLKSGSQYGIREDDPDMNRMRRAVMSLYRKMEYRILDDDSAFKNPDQARKNAEDVIRLALELQPMDEGIRAMFKNELDNGINVDITVLKLSRKDAAFKAALESGDPQRIAKAWQSRAKGLGGAAKYYQKLQLAQMKACAKGRSSKRGADMDDDFDAQGLVVGGVDDDADDLPTFNSRCEAATDNLRRIWERKAEADQAMQQASAPNAQVVAQLAGSIVPGATNMPNATITPGQNGYNPALAYALQIPGNFQQSFLDSLAPRLVPSTALGSGGMCIAGAAGQVTNCLSTPVATTAMPPALPLRTIATQ